jgi:hypothetical protein
MLVPRRRVGVAGLASWRVQARTSVGIGAACTAPRLGAESMAQGLPAPAPIGAHTAHHSLLLGVSGVREPDPSPSPHITIGMEEVEEEGGSWKFGARRDADIHELKLLLPVMPT